MSEHRQERVREVFCEVAKQPPGERTAYLQSASNGDRELESAVRALREAEAHAGDLLPESDMMEPSTASLEPVHEGPGSVIGRY
ncbi:MAG: hypothetical protein ACYTGC_13305, partial [Planctomycetota bacterium]